VLDQCCRVDGVTIPTKFCNGFPSLPTCVQPCIAKLKQVFSHILVRSHLYETLPEVCQCPDVGVRVDCLPSQHCIHIKHSITAPKKTVIMTLPADRDFSKLSFQGVEDSASPHTSFLSAVQNDGTRFHMLLIRKLKASYSA
jgi:hypothetical protein